MNGKIKGGGSCKDMHGFRIGKVNKMGEGGKREMY